MIHQRQYQNPAILIKLQLSVYLTIFCSCKDNSIENNVFLKGFLIFFTSLALCSCSFGKLGQLHDRFKFVLRGKPSRQCRCFDKCSPFPTSYYGGDFTELNIVHNALHCWLATPAGSRHCVCKVCTVSDVTKWSLISKLLFGRIASTGQTRI